MKSIMARVARFASGLSYDDIPKEVSSFMRTLMLDYLGCAIAGSTTPEFAVATKMLGMIGGDGPSTVWGLKKKADISSAAFVNAVAGHALVLTDSHRQAKLHPSVPTIPAAIAMVEYLGGSGKDLITALVVGYEVMIRLGKALNPVSHRERGFWATGTCGAVGAAAVTAKLMEYNEAKTLDALSIAATKMAGLWAFKESGSSSVLAFDGAFSTQSGIISSVIAGNGQRGPATVLEAKDGGFLNALSDSPSPEMMTKSLGRSYETLKVALKPYACSRGIHGAIDSVLLLVKQNSITEEDIKEIQVFTNHIAIAQYRDYTPSTQMAAKLSMPFCVALAVENPVKLYTMKLSHSDLRSRRTLRLARRVSMIVDKQIDSQYPITWATKVRIKTFGGAVYSHVTQWPKGEPENPMTKDEVESKFANLTSGIISPTKREALVECVSSLDAHASVARLSNLLFSYT